MKRLLKVALRQHHSTLDAPVLNRPRLVHVFASPDEPLQLLIEPTSIRRYLGNIELQLLPPDVHFANISSPRRFYHGADSGAEIHRASRRHYFEIYKEEALILLFPSGGKAARKYCLMTQGINGSKLRLHCFYRIYDLILSRIISGQVQIMVQVHGRLLLGILF